jgi:hypothetical protein
LRIFRYYGLPPIAGRTSIPEICRRIDRGHSTLITLQAYGDLSIPYKRDYRDGHYVVAIGYDRWRMFFDDPASYRRTWLSFDDLLDRWHDTDRGRRIHRWGCFLDAPPRWHSADALHMD